jgi:hypothetical protein
MMTRLQDWQTPFFAYLEARRGLPFAWGSNDCCTFAAGAVDAITGSTLATDVQANYTDEASAMAYLATFPSLEDAVTHWMQTPSQAPNFAGPGDMVLIDGDKGPTIGICLGANVASAGTEAGVSYRPRAKIICCWRV